MPVDAAIVRRILGVLERALRILRMLREEGREAFVSDEAVQDRVARNAQLAAQAAVDLALHIIAAAGGVAPETYAATLAHLGRLGIVPPELCERVAGVARLRNVLVHGYLEVDHGRVFDELDWIEDMVAFAGHVERWVEAQSAP